MQAQSQYLILQKSSRWIRTSGSLKWSMLETFPQFRQRILVVLLVHNNNPPQTRWVIYSVLLQLHLILQRMRAKVDWQVRIPQAREPMTSSALMLQLHLNSSSNLKCSKIKPQLLKLIILLQVIFWTFSQQMSHQAVMASSPKITNLTISLQLTTNHWPLHKTKSLIMTNTPSLTASTTKISSSSNLQEQQALVLSKINSRLRATCRAMTPSASWWIKAVAEWHINKTVILSTDLPPKQVVSSQWWGSSSQWAWVACNNSSNSSSSNNSSNSSSLWAWEEWQVEWVCKLISLKGHLDKTHLIFSDNLNSRILDNLCQLEALAPFNSSLNSPRSQTIYSISEQVRLSKWIT